MLNTSPMQMLVKIMIPPPPVPWIARAAINMVMLLERAHRRDPTEKKTIASRKMGLLPQMSDIFPQSRVEAAVDRRYAEPIHVYPADELKCWVIVGSGVVVIVYSRKLPNRPCCWR